MQKTARYTLISVTCLVCAVIIAFCTWLILPPVTERWPSAVWFVLLATLAEFLAVAVSQNTGKRTLVAPTAPVFWAAICVMGPVLGMLTCVTSAVLGMIATGTCYYTSRAIESRKPSDVADNPGPPGIWNSAYTSLVSFISRIGENWYFHDIRAILEVTSLHAGTLALCACLSGALYGVVGGQFLCDTGPRINLWSGFIVPFAVMVVLWVSIEHGIYAAVIATIDPVPGLKGAQGVWMRAKLLLIEDVLPVWRGELFLAVVALMLSYLYAHIGVWGFVLAVMPTLALRDFFHQWVETRDAYVTTITTLATYMQHYHPYTRGHLKRVAEMSERLARELRLPVESIRHINTAGFLHDIGKVGVSEEILDKTAKLTDEEWERIKEHPVKGADIISHLEFLDGIVDWIRYHHKWHDGRGYPDTDGSGAGIPIEAEIIATADAFDAMTDDRELTLDWKCDSCGYVPENGERPRVCPGCGAEKRRTYREPKSLDEAIDELRRGAGTQFHPKVVKAFLTMVERDGIRLGV